MESTFLETHLGHVGRDAIAFGTLANGMKELLFTPRAHGPCHMATVVKAKLHPCHGGEHRGEEYEPWLDYATSSISNLTILGHLLPIDGTQLLQNFGLDW